MAEQTKAVSTQVFSPEQEAERLRLLTNYHAQDHLARWNAYDKQAGKNREVVYYPAVWRLYELNLRYPIANFDCDIVHMDAEKDFCIVRARLYLGTDFAVSPKRAVAHKQGKLSELDKVETKAMARAARNFGVGTEHALDMDDLEADSVGIQPAGNGHAVTVVEADTPKEQALHELAHPGSYEQHEANNNQEPERTAQDISPAIQRMIDIAKHRAEKLGVSWEAVKKEARVNFPDTKLVASSFVHINGWLTNEEKKASAGAGK